MGFSIVENVPTPWESIFTLSRGSQLPYTKNMLFFRILLVLTPHPYPHMGVYGRQITHKHSLAKVPVVKVLGFPWQVLSWCQGRRAGDSPQGRADKGAGLSSAKVVNFATEAHASWSCNYHRPPYGDRSEGWISRIFDDFLSYFVFLIIFDPSLLSPYPHMGSMVDKLRTSSHLQRNKGISLPQGMHFLPQEMHTSWPKLHFLWQEIISCRKKCMPCGTAHMGPSHTGPKW